jgi:hypothetical protein
MQMSEEEKFLAELYSTSLIFSPFINVDMKTQLREIIAREVTSSISDFLAASFALKGPLAQVIVIPNNPVLDDNFYLATRKKLLQQNILASSHSVLTETFLQSVTTLISVPDSGACKCALQILTVLTTLAANDHRLLPFLGQDAFGAVLAVLLFAVSVSKIHHPHHSSTN